MSKPNLDAIQARYDGAQLALSSDAGTLRQLHRLTGSANDVPALLAYARDLEARIGRVREAHAPMPAAGRDGESVTEHCPACSTYYPCPTIAALTATEGQA